MIGAPSRIGLALAALVALSGCGTTTDPVPAGPRSVAPPLLATKTEPALTLTSTDGVRFSPGPSRIRDDLTTVEWRTVRFTSGTLTLDRLIPGNACRIDRVDLGPVDGDLRRVTVWAPFDDGPCARKPRAIVLDVPSWTTDTVAAPSELDLPDPRATNQRKLTGTEGSAVLQPDRRSIIVGYTHGGCHRLAEATATLEGSRIKVRVITASEPNHTVCPGVLRRGHTLIRLPSAAPPRARVTVAACEPLRARCR